MTHKIRLGTKQRLALITAYAPDYDLTPSEHAGDGGFSKRTLASLQRRGLLRPAEDGSWDEAALTYKGRQALGIARKAPKTLKGAVRHAVTRLVPWDVPLTEIEYGDQISAVCVDEDWANDATTWTDTAGVLAAVPDSEGFGGPFGAEEDPMVFWSAVARRISEAGFPVVAERYQTTVFLEKDE